MSKSDREERLWKVQSRRIPSGYQEPTLSELNQEIKNLNRKLKEEKLNQEEAVKANMVVIDNKEYSKSELPPKVRQFVEEAADEEKTITLARHKSILKSNSEGFLTLLICSNLTWAGLWLLTALSLKGLI